MQNRVVCRRLPAGSGRIHALRQCQSRRDLAKNTFLLRDVNYNSINVEKNTESNGIRPDAEFGRALVARRKQSLGFLAKKYFV
jgi:hypothetical protein